MSRQVRIPRNANVVNAVPGIGVDMNDGALTVIGAVGFLAAAMFHRAGLGILILIVCYSANRYYLGFKKNNMPGLWAAFKYRMGWDGYSKGLPGSNKYYLGDNKPIWHGAEAAFNKLQKRKDS